MKVISLLLTLVGFCYGKVEIKVGGYPFPPFVEKQDNQYAGLTLDLINLLNSSQQKYEFKFVITSSKRRYQDYNNKLYDLIFFENKLWGWKDIKVEESKVFLKGGEVYITYNDRFKNQSYFTDLKDKKINAYLGFHYGLFDFSTDEELIKKKFNVNFSTNHESNILKIANNRSDIAIVTKSYLYQFFTKNPELENKILVSNNYDQVYEHRILLRPNSRPTKDEINDLLDMLKSRNLLSRLWSKYGIDQ